MDRARNSGERSHSERGRIGAHGAMFCLYKLSQRRRKHIQGKVRSTEVSVGVHKFSWWMFLLAGRNGRSRLRPSIFFG